MRKEALVLKDQYYTDPEIAKKLIMYFDKKIGFDHFKLIIEPSAGNGSFLTNIPKNKSRLLVGFDIEPKHPNIKKLNFLQWKPNYNISSDKILCIGNPPFGRQHKLARNFVEKCASFSDHIVFILPAAYKYAPKGFTEEFSVILPNDIFIDPKGYQYNQCLLTKFVYYTQNDTKKKSAKIRNNGLWTLQSSTNPTDIYNSDFRIVRVSGSAGRIFARNNKYFRFNKDNSNVYTTNNHYIKINSPLRKYIPNIINDLIQYQQNGKWKFNNTTTFNSIDQTQLTKVLNRITSGYDSP
jgi:predicted RNA methylase